MWPGNPLLIGINGIALSSDGRTLYWTVTTGTHAHAVPTEMLRNAAATDEQIAAKIQDLGSVGGNTDGIVKFAPKSRAMWRLPLSERRKLTD